MRVRNFVALVSALALLPSATAAQFSTGNGISLGMVRTEAERTAVRLVLNLLKGFNLAEQQINNERNWLVFFTPEVDLRTGANDTFSSLIAKASGTFVFFDDTVVAGLVTPKSDFYHMVPVEAGFEANRDFTTVNGIAEIGYIPWFQGRAPELLKSLMVGIFLQAGYKFERDTTTVSNGDPVLPDESAEDAEHALGRVKASMRWSPKLNLPDSNVAFVTAADGWADVLNGKFYYRMEGTLRVKLFGGQFLDLTWERGAGAPNFNQGNQFSANLRIAY